MRRRRGLLLLACAGCCDGELMLVITDVDVQMIEM
jgi:hypothetical protein